MGFANGVREWRRYLKPGGVLAVSEITWLGATRPAELQNHWEQLYPEIDTASSKLAVLKQNGYSPLGYFVLPKRCWLENYYQPMEAGFQAFLQRNANCEGARAAVEAERREIALYHRHKAHYGYGFYIARKVV